MKRIIFSLILFSVVQGIFSQDMPVLWEIGQKDRKPDEFALIPSNYQQYSEKFGQTPVFYDVKRQNIHTDFPFVLPGPLDIWAGSLGRQVIIVFGIDGLKESCPAKLELDYVEVHPSLPPSLLITVNDYVVKIDAPVGKNQDYLTNHIAGSQDLSSVIDIPAKVLKKGDNRVIIQSLSGSWLAFDAISLKTKEKLKVIPSTGRMSILEIKPTRMLVHGKDKELRQLIEVTINNPDKPQTIDLIVEGTQYEQVRIDKGINTIKTSIPEVTIEKDVDISIVLNKKILDKYTVKAFPVRHWTIYIYPHSHVDIGYTNTQENVELIHLRNLKYGIELAKKTKDYPQGARYLWNPEVVWPIERFLKKATPEQKNELLDAIQKGYIHVDAGYVHTNTSAAADEELLELFREGKAVEKWTGKKVETMVQVDIPGVSWGVVSAASKLGIKYCLALFNGSDRVGLSYEINFKPFWWIGPDGKSKMLFLQPGSYVPGAQLKGYMYWPLMAGQTDTAKLLKIVKTDHPRQHFIDQYLAEKLPELEKSADYPYDIFPMTWCMADNTPIDADLPEAVKSWNEEFAYPRLVICSATEMMKAFEEKYGDQLPSYRGDFTECWTDGLGTNAQHTGVNRNVKERLIQTETLWSMLHRGQPAPRDEFNEAWRNTILGTEHTWAYMNPSQEPICSEILGVKFGYFEKAHEKVEELLKTTLPKASNTSHIAVFNTHSWESSGLVTLDAELSSKFSSITDEDGKPVTCQRLTSGELVFMAQKVPALGARKYKLADKKTKLTGTMVKGNTLDNGIIKVMLDPHTGDITSLIHGGVEFAGQNATGVNINSFRYLHGDDNSSEAIAPVRSQIQIKENGPLVASLLVVSQAEGCNELQREIRIIAGQPFVEINNIVDKKAITAKEGIHFGFAFNIDNPKTHVDIPWAVIKLEEDQLPMANRNWIAFQRWLDISNQDKGVTWCSLDACMFENGDITANILGGAFKSPQWIRKLTPSSTIYSWALNNHWHTNFPLSQEGIIPFRYRILPHNTKFDAAVSNRFGTEQIHPLLVSTIPPDFDLKNNFSIKANPSVSLSVLKTVDEGKAEITRLRSISTSDETVMLTWNGQKPRKVFICDNGEEAGNIIVDNSVVVPAMGFVTIKAIW